MVIIVSLLTAAVFGSGDFCGGLAAKRATAVQVVAGSHVVGLVGAVGASLLFASGFRLEDLALGAVGGVFGGLAVGLLYRRLAVGPMHVVAPLTAITSAVVPTAWGFVNGDRLSVLVWLGIAFGLVAIGLVSGSASDATAPVTSQVVGESLLAGCGFGTFFILLDATDVGSAPWPVVGARLSTSLLLVTFLLVRRGPVVPRERSTLGLVALTGVFDTMANIGFLYATNRGDLAVASVLTSLYPISTVVLARLVLGERMTRLQGWGFIGALGATTLIAAG